MGEAQDCYVQLTQYADVSGARRAARMFTPEEHFRQAPKLERIAVVSCPVEGPKGENTNDILNAMLNDALNHASLCAEQKGWYVGTEDYDLGNARLEAYLTL